MEVVRLDHRQPATSPARLPTRRELGPHPGGGRRAPRHGGRRRRGCERRWARGRDRCRRPVRSRRSTFPSRSFTPMPVLWRGQVWLSTDPGFVRFDPLVEGFPEPAVTLPPRFGDCCGFLEADDRGIWFLSPDVEGGTDLNVFDPVTGEATALVALDAATPVAMAVAPDAVWILNYEGTLTHVDIGSSGTRGYDRCVGGPVWRVGERAFTAPSAPSSWDPNVTPDSFSDGGRFLDRAGGRTRDPDGRRRCRHPGRRRRVHPARFERRLGGRGARRVRPVIERLAERHRPSRSRSTRGRRASRPRRSWPGPRS